VIGLAQAVRDPPRRNEIIEGVTALAALAAVMTVIIVSLPPELWESVAPVTLLFPILVGLRPVVSRCSPVRRRSSFHLRLFGRQASGSVISGIRPFRLATAFRAS